VQVELWSLRAVGYLMQSRTMLDAVEAVTALTGRMKGLPEWTQLGAVVGLEGGTANVTAIVDRMYDAGVPMAGMDGAVPLIEIKKRRLYECASVILTPLSTWTQASGCKTGWGCSTAGTETDSSGTGSSITTTTQVCLVRSSLRLCTHAMEISAASLHRYRLV
jgi:hypothetical protein